MRYKLTFVAGFAAGYVLGTKAGRKRYDTISDGVRRLVDCPVVQEAAGVLQAQASGAIATARSTVDRQGERQGQRPDRRLRAAGSSARQDHSANGRWSTRTRRRPTPRRVTRSSAARPDPPRWLRRRRVVSDMPHYPDPADPYEDAGLPATDDALPGKLITGDVQDDVVVPTDHATYVNAYGTTDLEAELGEPLSSRLAHEQPDAHRAARRARTPTTTGRRRRPARRRRTRAPTSDEDGDLFAEHVGTDGGGFSARGERDAPRPGVLSPHTEPASAPLDAGSGPVSLRRSQRRQVSRRGGASSCVAGRRASGHVRRGVPLLVRASRRTSATYSELHSPRPLGRRYAGAGQAHPEAQLRGCCVVDRVVRVCSCPCRAADLDPLHVGRQSRGGARVEPRRTGRPPRVGLQAAIGLVRQYVVPFAGVVASRSVPVVRVVACTAGSR